MCRWYQELKCCCSGSETPGAGVVGEGPGQEGRHMKCSDRMTTLFREFLSGSGQSTLHVDVCAFEFYNCR